MGDVKPDVRTIFCGLLEQQTPEEVAEYLDASCGNDTDLREQIDALLESHREAGGFLGGDQWSANGLGEDDLFERANIQIDGYRLMEQIGEGGMGVVFVAEQKRPIRREVAVKVIKPGMDTKAVVARFDAERQVLAMMDHPHIARVLDAGSTESGRPFFAMELVRGIPITEYCDLNQLTIRQRLELFIQVCHAIQHAHQKGIIHRDIKPSNVLVTLQDGKPNPKVIDFGIAKALSSRLSDKTAYTDHLQIVGTLLYMSPEQAELSDLDVDTRSDIYSLGVLLYELIAGRTPFDRDNLVKAAFDEQRRIIREQGPPSASHRIRSLGVAAEAVAKSRQTSPYRLQQSVRGDLDWIVHKALEKDRTGRYGTAAEFLKDVERFLNDEPVLAGPPSRGYRLRKFVIRNRTALITAAVVGASLFAGTIIAGSQAMRAHFVAGQLRVKVAELESSLGIVRDYTMLLALSGDPEDESQALSIAHMTQMSDVWQQMLQGRSAMQRGDYDSAIQHFEQGTQLEGDEVLACEGMLLDALVMAGEVDAAEALRPELSRKFQSLTSPSVEEMLFVAGRNSSGSVSWINRALQKRMSLVGQLIRARAIAHQAIVTDTLTQMATAIADISDAKQRLPHNPFVLAESLYVHTVAMLLNRKHGEPIDEFQYLRKTAREDLVNLRSRSSNPVGLLFMAWYLDSFESREEADAAWLRVLKEGNQGWHKLHAAATLVRSGDVVAAQKYLGSEETMDKVALGMVLSCDPSTHSQARAIYDELRQRERRIDFAFGTAMDVLLTLGPAQEVKKEANKLLADRQTVFIAPFDKEMIRFLAGKTDVEALLKSCGNNATESMAHFAIARLCIANEDWRRAEAHLNECKKIRLLHISDFYWAKAYLERYKDRLSGAHDAELQ